MSKFPLPLYPIPFKNFDRGGIKKSCFQNNFRILFTVFCNNDNVRTNKTGTKYNNYLKKHFTTSIEIFYLYIYVKSGLTFQYIPTNNHADNTQNSCRYADNQVFH